MIVDYDKIRKFLIGISFILFFVIYFLLLSSFITLINFDEIFTQVFLYSYGSFFKFIFPLIGFICKPIILYIITFLFIVILWKINYKISACWLFFTIFFASLLDWFFNWSLSLVMKNGQLEGLRWNFPSLRVLISFIIIQFLFVFFIQAFGEKAKSRKNKSIFILILLMILVCFSVIFLRYGTVIDVISALLFGFAWFLTTEEIYYKYARKIRKVPIFSHSYI